MLRREQNNFVFFCVFYAYVRIKGRILRISSAAVCGVPQFFVTDTAKGLT